MPKKSSDVNNVNIHIKLQVSLSVLVVDTGFGLGRYLGDCRPALPKGRKYQMVKNKSDANKTYIDIGT